ncbi:Serine/threonine-protein kinase PrkC [Maioricimonas rarisocia]|uniref:Serine/threonine-protein kinase PrkC n=1 Tax=Maioricimonas rarisocia TaxID=2528026 RepID=A0A517ZEQ9_9PLAN|nr:protein kinase [Maioricimonas rarisocia]QDU40946.1 Serine/threonine-protein kinase PrkC [Maioricimonas rarisocia]
MQMLTTMATLERRYSCPPRPQLVAFLKGALTPEETEQIALHIDECGDCTELLPEIDAQLAPGLTPPRPTRLPFIDEAACSRLTRLLCAAPAGRNGGGDSSTAANAIRIGRFEVVRRLAAGTDSTLFLANDPLLGRLVALRVPSPHTIGNAEHRRQFIDAGNTALQVDHPHLIPVHEVIPDRERPFVVSRYCSGPTLQEWLECFQETLGVVPAARLARNLADAMEHAFAKGVVYRSISPKNVLVDSIGTVDLRSLPDAVQISAFQLPASIRPTPPEDAAPDGVRSDVFAISGLLYRLLTGLQPTRGGRIRRLVCRGPVPPRRYNPAIPRGLQDIILAGLAAPSAPTYASAAELRDDLDRFLARATSAI